MLVIVSDLHLTDHTTGLDIPAGAFRLFRQRLEDMAYDASKRTESLYDPIKSFDLLLLGDIFDLLRTTKWNDENEGEPGYTRPWDDPSNPNFVNKVNAIVDDIFAKNIEAFQIFHDLSTGSAISLPPATPDGKVNQEVSRDWRTPERVHVNVNIHYMCGNHDWIFHLPGGPFDLVRAKVIAKMGLGNPPSPFPHEPKESNKLLSILNQHKVFARHGDKYDPTNYVKEQGRNYASLGDALVVEVFNPFPVLVKKMLGGRLPEEFFEEMNEMGSIRPSTMTPVWVASIMNRYEIKFEDRKIINQIWKKLINQFVKHKFLKVLDTKFIGPVDGLRVLLRILSNFSLDKLEDLAPVAEKIINFHSAVSGGSVLGFDRNATKEDAYESGEVKFIVYGHTHDFKVSPLRTLWKDNQPFHQVYINSGTWHPLYELSGGNTQHHRFFAYKTMSFLGFYLENERKGRSYEAWTGILDV